MQQLLLCSQTPWTYNSTNTEDLEYVLQHIRSRYPADPILAAGISLGGLILTNYLAKAGPRSGLVAAMVTSSFWDVFQSSASLQATANRILFNRILARNVVENVRRHEDMFRSSVDLDAVYKSQTIRDFDATFTSRVFGYRDWQHYYRDACIHEKLHRIKVPTLFLNAADDPFAPEKSIPMFIAPSSSHCAILLTSHGGHIAFLEGLLPRGKSYMDRMFGEYIQAIFHNLETVEELRKIL